MKGHNAMIDLLRFFAAFIVAIYHSNLELPPVENWYRHLISYGWAGVPIFFVISGYCILLSAYHSKDWIDFSIKRFFRIFPAYWASLLVVLAAAIFQKLYTGTNSVHNIPQSATELLANITMLTAPFTAVKTMSMVYWSLTCELLFYLLIAGVLIFRKGISIYLLLIISTISLITPIQKTGVLFFLDQWPGFSLGIVIYYLFHGSNRAERAFSILLLIISLCGLYLKFIVQGNIAYAVAAVISFILILSGSFLAIRENSISRLGKYSYSIYLLHVPIGIFIFSRFRNEYTKTNLTANIIYDLVVYAVISGFAILMFQHIERKGIVYGKLVRANLGNIKRKLYDKRAVDH